MVISKRDAVKFFWRSSKSFRHTTKGITAETMNGTSMFVVGLPGPENQSRLRTRISSGPLERNLPEKVNNLQTVTSVESAAIVPGWSAILPVAGFGYDDRHPGFLLRETGRLKFRDQSFPPFRFVPHPDSANSKFRI